MQILFEITLPVFGAIFVGWLVCRVGIFGPESSELINRFVYFVSFPALLFSVVARTPVEKIFYWPFLFAWGGSQAAIYVVTIVASLIVMGREPLANLAVRCMTTTCASTAFLGVPLAIAAFGQDAALPAIMATTVIVVFYFSLTILLIEASSNSEKSGLEAVKGVAISLMKNPLMLGVVAGAIVAGFATLPTPIARLAELLGAAAIPASLVAIGMFLAGQSVRAVWVGITLATVISLVAHPIVAWLIVDNFFSLDPLWGNSTILMAALPPATSCFVIAQRFNVLVAETSGTLWISTLISVATVSVALLWLGV